MNKQQGLIAALVIIFSFGLGNIGHTASSDSMSAERLQRLEDTEAIKTLLIRYGRALDRQDIKAYSELFAEDGTWSGGMGSATGPEAIRKMVEEGISKIPDGKFDNSFHIMSSMDIDVNGSTATAWSRWTWVIVGQDGKPKTERAGHYEDTLTRVDGVWKFKTRKAVTEINK